MDENKFEIKNRVEGLREKIEDLVHGGWEEVMCEYRLNVYGACDDYANAFNLCIKYTGEMEKLIKLLE